MQVRALQEKLRIQEIPMSYRNRIRRSKISGTVSGVINAGLGIIGTILRLAWSRQNKPHNKSAK